MEETPIVRLEAWRLTCPEEAHPYLRQMLALPASYGDNLDALYDILTERGPLGIVLMGSETMKQTSWGKRLLGVFLQAVNENPGLHLVFRD
ncbi:MAG: barstar family protein [Pseudoflavonifractor sp.]|nr:barstar family protein [Pseudoflavonifractor sp.]